MFGEEYSSFWLVERAGLLQVSTIRYVPAVLVLAERIFVVPLEYELFWRCKCNTCLQCLRRYISTLHIVWRFGGCRCWFCSWDLLGDLVSDSRLLLGYKVCIGESGDWIRSP